MKISNSILANISQATGRTPLVQLTRITSQRNKVSVKLEGFNPSGSAKDRVAKAIIDDAESKKLLKPGSLIIESTSGNLGQSLAQIAAARGYTVIVIVDPTIPQSTLQTLEIYGAMIVKVEEKDNFGGYLGTRIKARDDLLKRYPDAFCPRQYDNPLNPVGHQATGVEILEALGNKIDYIVVPISTGGTVSGIGNAIKKAVPSAKIIGVDAQGSKIFGGQPQTRLQIGIGSSAYSSEELPNLRLDLIDRVIVVSDEDAFVTARTLAVTEGIAVGGSSGSTLFASLLLDRENRDCRIVAVLPDRHDRYVDQFYSDSWMKDKGFSLIRTREEVWRRLDAYHGNCSTKLVTSNNIPVTYSPSRIPVKLGE